MTASWINRSVNFACLLGCNLYRRTAQAIRGNYRLGEFWHLSVARKHGAKSYRSTCKHQRRSVEGWVHQVAERHRLTVYCLIRRRCLCLRYRQVSGALARLALQLTSHANHPTSNARWTSMVIRARTSLPKCTAGSAIFQTSQAHERSTCTTVLGVLSSIPQR